jgi:hypothetical protein
MDFSPATVPWMASFCPSWKSLYIAAGQDPGAVMYLSPREWDIKVERVVILTMARVLNQT